MFRGLVQRRMKWVFRGLLMSENKKGQADVGHGCLSP